MSEPYVAQITMFAGNYNPRGYAFCSGQLLPISQNTALFSLLGTTFGGDGETTYGLPDFRGRNPVGSQGNNAGPGLQAVQLGQKRGAINTVLNVTNVPQHQHTVDFRCNAGIANRDTPVNNYFAVYEQTSESYHSTANTTLAAQTTLNQGGNQAFSNLQPYLAINFIIALFGIYPSEN